MQLSDDDKALIRDQLDRGEPLPERFRWLLFAEPRETELIWPGKTSDVTTAILPFQSIEQIDEPRAETSADVYGEGDLFGAGGRQTGGWSNKLIWGDNKLILSSLKGGPLRKQIEAAGGLKLVYIDPPFDVGADFSFNVEIGAEQITKASTIIEDIAYRDTWGRGRDSYVAMVYERLRLIYDLLSTDASIYVHVEPNVGNYLKLILDDIFGSENRRTEIAWKRTSSHGNVSKNFGEIWESIYFYAKNPNQYVWNQQYIPFEETYIKAHFNGIDPDGRRYTTSDLTNPGLRPNLRYEYKGFKPHHNGWKFTIDRMRQLDAEGRLYFPDNPEGKIRLKRYLDETPGQLVD